MAMVAGGIVVTGGLSCCSHLAPVDTTKAPLVVAGQWNEVGGFPTASSERDLSRWWRSFGDGELTRLIGHALKHNPDIASSVAAVTQARAQRTEQVSSLYPSLSYSGSNNLNKNWEDSAASSSSVRYSAGLSASWEPDFYGKNRNSVLAATADTNAAMDNLSAARSSLAAETALAYFQLRSAEASLAIVERSIVSQEETTKITKWRTQAGEIDQLEFDRANSSLENARSAIPAFKQNIAQAKNRINLLCGELPSTLAVSSSGSFPEPKTKLAIGIPAETIRQRADVRAAGQRWVAAIARIRVAEADQFPSFNLSGSLGINALSTGKIIDPSSVSASLISGLTGPIFDAGRIRAGIEGQSAAEEQAFQGYRSNILTALSEVEDALIACKRTQEKIASLEKAAVSARSAATLATQKYDAGIIDMSTVLDTQRSELSVEQSLISARLDKANSYVGLYKALGGGW